MPVRLSLVLGRGGLHVRLAALALVLSLGGVGAGFGCATAGDGVVDDTVLPGADGGGTGSDSSIPRFEGGNPSADSGNPAQDSGTLSPDGSTNDGGVNPHDGGNPPDASSNCVHAVNSVCGLVPQCDCTATQTCDVTDMNTGAAQCVGAGSQPPAKACNTTGDCAPGYTCYGGACRAYCNNPDQPCGLPGTGNCSQRKTDAGTNITNLEVCLFKCNLDDPNACGGMPASGPVASCNPLKTGNSDCRTAGRSTGNCDPPTLCAPAYGCITTTNPIFGTSNDCYKWCKVGVAGTCTGGTTCTSLGTKVFVDAVEFGVCQ